MTTPAFDFSPFDGLPPEEFLTPRLRLRALRADDAPLMFALYSNDVENCRYMSFPVTGRLEDTAKFVEGATAYRRGSSDGIRHFVWIAELTDCGAPIGSCGIGPHANKSYCVGGGYILNKQYWGRGYASEAWKVIVDWAKTQPRVYRIEAEHAVENPASGRVMEKAGMTKEGVLRRYTVFPNIGPEPRDAVVYAWARR